MKKRKTSASARISADTTGNSWRMHLGKSEDVLKTYPENHFHSVVCDPPYGLSQFSNNPDRIADVLQSWLNNDNVKNGESGFLNESWDSMVPSPALWREVYRVMRPGAYLAAFSGSRNQDLMAISLRLAGFQLVDVVAYIMRRSFPMLPDLGRSIEKKIRKWGYVPSDDHQDMNAIQTNLSGGTFQKSIKRKATHIKTKQIVVQPSHELSKTWSDFHTGLKQSYQPILLARKPALGTTVDNLIQWGTGALNIGATRLEISSNDDEPNSNSRTKTQSPFENSGRNLGKYPSNVLGDLGKENDQYFFNPHNVISRRPTLKDKNIYMPDGVKNDHPTPKPPSLMEWLVRLVTPVGGTVLDPFAGSGTTGIAALHEAFSFVGVEADQHYHEIAHARIANCDHALRNAA